MCMHTFHIFNANSIKFLCVLKFCVLNISVPLQFADTIIVNICEQLVRAWLYYAGLEVGLRCIYLFIYLLYGLYTR